MSNYYTQYSFEVPVSDPIEISAYIYEALEKMRKHDYADAKAIFGDEADMAYGIAVKATDGYLWIHERGTTNVRAAMMLTHWLITSVEGTPDEVLIEWSTTHSKPWIDRFGGGAALVTHDGVSVLTTSELRDILKEMGHSYSPVRNTTIGV